MVFARSEVGENEIMRTVARLHDFYAGEDPTAKIEQWGQAAKLKISTDENFKQIEPFVGKTISKIAFETIRHFTNSFYMANPSVFERRIQQGRILDCHGDLRLDHVHITADAVTIFDCIEFNDRFRFIDIANDLAFLAMDFDFESRRDLANLFLQTAAREFSDPGLLELADFYKCYRAFVRGKVESIQVTSETAADREERARRATRYFRLALRYATIGSEPCVLVVMGRIATGKSSVAKQLGSELDWPVFSSDKVRKTLAAVPLTMRTAPGLRGELYSEQMTDQTYQQLLEEGIAAVNMDNGVVLDATFASQTKRDFLCQQCVRAGFRLQVIELETDRDEIAERLKGRHESNAEFSDARLEDLDKLSATYEPPTEGEDVISVSTTGSVLDTVRLVLMRLAEK